MKWWKFCLRITWNAPPPYSGIKQKNWTTDGHAIAIRLTCAVYEENMCILGLKFPRTSDLFMFLYLTKKWTFPNHKKFVIHTHKIRINAALNR